MALKRNQGDPMLPKRTLLRIASSINNCKKKKYMGAAFWAAEIIRSHIPVRDGCLERQRRVYSRVFEELRKHGARFDSKRATQELDRQMEIVAKFSLCIVYPSDNT